MTYNSRPYLKRKTLIIAKGLENCNNDKIQFSAYFEIAAAQKDNLKINLYPLNFTLIPFKSY